MNRSLGKQFSLALAILVLSCCTFAPSPLTPTPVQRTSVAGKWTGLAVFHDAQGAKRAFIINFVIAEDEKHINDLQIGFAYRWPLDGSWDGTNANKTTAEISEHSFLAIVQIPLLTNDPYKVDFPDVRFAGSFVSTVKLEGTFTSASVLGNGNWEAAPADIWDWKSAEAQ